MKEDSARAAYNEARNVIDTFGSVGAIHFDVTLTTAAGEKDSFRRGVPLSDLKRTLPDMLDATTATKRNVIVRPHSPNINFVQLDDLKAEQLAPLAPAVFLTLETSPGNFQAWVALRGMDEKDFARRLRKGTGADATASGATRVARSLNFKDKYAPNFPRVRIAASQPGRTTTTAELEQLGLVAPAEEVALLPVSPAHSMTGSSRKWPSYAIALDGAPLNSEETGPDVSRADFVWCMTAITWGFGTDETAKRLMQESTKAHAQGKGYADLTARNAALAVERRRQQRQNRHRHG